MFDFEKLEVYKKAKALNHKVRKLIATGALDPNTSNQLHRAAFSIMLNIAEGTGRYTGPDKRRFIVIARASSFECAAIFDFLYEDEVIDKKQFKDLYNHTEEVSRMLHGMIRHFQR